MLKNYGACFLHDLKICQFHVLRYLSIFPEEKIRYLVVLIYVTINITSRVILPYEHEPSR